MKLAQSSYIPAQGKKPGWSDMPWLIAYSAKGLWQLVRARIIFANLQAREIRERNHLAKSSGTQPRPLAPETVARIGYVLPRLSDRLPWRSDCLIQAIAGQNWLSAHGVASEIQIGVENPRDGKFGAHAWLMCDGEVVTGGDIDRYEVLLADSRLDGDSPPGTRVNKPD